ncbi:hypothetical protein [Pseudonocardia phyllosphaerae]|uniref:hypothetical protein n=1 Tax=Pseudonocardia phyllosphaerae TaxID=3390502 RepID=UPI003979770A
MICVVLLSNTYSPDTEYQNALFTHMCRPTDAEVRSEAMPTVGDADQGENYVVDRG